MSSWQVLFFLTCSLSFTIGQHHPPGVNPQIYQQPNVQYAPGVNPQLYQQQQQPPQLTPQQQHDIAIQQQQQQQQQQYQQQQQQLQQRQQQQQQQQQQHQQQQQQQPPPQQNMQPPQAQHHPDHQNQHPQQVFNSEKMAQERDHIGEHVGVPVDTTKMSEQELQFHYFKMHDADNNNKLDGCELVKSLVHWHDESNHDPKGGAPMPDPKIFTDEELLAMIDPILEQDDKNRDGFIDYPEFIQAQQGAAAAAIPS